MGNDSDRYRVKKIFGQKKDIRVSVPGSKSITNRAILIAALAEGESRLQGALFSKDAEDMMNCLRSLGISIASDEEKEEIVVLGCGGRIPKKEGEVNVGNAGTAARFITALLAFSGGRFHVDAGEQMRKRPMQPLIDVLRNLGAEIECKEKEGYFPFYIDASKVHGGKISLDTTLSSQFLSAILMTSFMLKEEVSVEFFGRKSLPYVEMTRKIMESFGLNIHKSGEKYSTRVESRYIGREYRIEPDVSAACYFYAMAILLQSSVMVEGVFLDSLQGDIEFLKVLERLGASVIEEKEGVVVIGNTPQYWGIEIDMNHFSDQTMTLAALALFALSHTTIKGISHIRHQESDRLLAIYNEVVRLGARAEMGKDYIIIFPMHNIKKEVEVETYDDHRMAMAFSLVGLRRDGIIIKNPGCVEKTFKEYFTVLDRIVNE